MTPISARFRLALAMKAVLLSSLSAVFLGLAWVAWAKWHWPLLARGSGALLLSIAAGSVARAAGLGVADVVLGQALVGTGAKPLKSRRSGYSLRLPSGRFVEYVLFNPWPTLSAEATYTVTYGRFSGVLVAPPQPEQ
ncbi:MAG: hypothetical protein Q8N23_11195 [Archangium sp.]|nr:hypothetical protein [Archangium sp.]MDP3153229.1 hypothetical protein [Archangium sp.]MDP3570263.1 hypothetical protein [Archangium sp.]